MQKVGEHVTEDQLHDILSEVDVNKNAQVDLGEFLQVFTTLSKFLLKVDCFEYVGYVAVEPSVLKLRDAHVIDIFNA